MKNTVVSFALLFVVARVVIAEPFVTTVAGGLPQNGITYDPKTPKNTMFLGVDCQVGMFKGDANWGTVAGTLSCGSGNNLVDARTSATFSSNRLLLHADGNQTYVSDGKFVRCLDFFTTGLVTRFAGVAGGTVSNSDQRATSAGLTNPRSMYHIDSKLYVYDDTVLRVVERTTGIISTVLTGLSGMSAGMWADSNGASLFFTEYLLGVVRRLDIASGILSNYAGTPSVTSKFSPPPGTRATAASFLTPSGLWGNTKGDLIFTDLENANVQFINATTTNVVLITGSPAGLTGSASNVVALSARLNNPTGIVGKPDGTFYITDSANGRLLKIFDNAVPSPVPTSSPPSRFPTQQPSVLPSSVVPSRAPSSSPTTMPTTAFPTLTPTMVPTTKIPSSLPTLTPTTRVPTPLPSVTPTTETPSSAPTDAPTVDPSANPTFPPTFYPTNKPTAGSTNEGCCQWRSSRTVVTVTVSEDGRETRTETVVEYL